MCVSSAMTRLNVMKLINLVKSNPALWDHKDEDYNNKSYSKKLWEEIGEKMKCTSEACKLKWRSLRDVFRRELKKYQTRLNDPNIPDKIFPRWYYFKELQFLTEHLSGLENTTGSPRETSDEYFESLYVKNEPELLDDEEILETDDDILLTLTEGNIQDDQDDSHCFRLADSNQLDENQFDKSIKYYRDSTKRPLDSFQEVRARKRTKRIDKNDIDDDSDHHFLMSLLPFLKAIPQHRKMFVRTKIQNVFCDEMENGGSTS